MRPPSAPAGMPASVWHARARAFVGPRVLLAIASAMGAGALVLDLGLATESTGAFAAVGMFALLGALVRAVLRAESWLEHRRTRALLGTNAFAALVLVATAFARVHVALQQLDAVDASSYAETARLYTAVFAAVAGASAVYVAMPSRLARLVLRLVQRPALLLVGSFAFLVAGATILLALPPAIKDVSHVSFVDALFMATSAVCVTGLAVHDPASTYTQFGEVVILLSIQLGGVGIMTIAALSLMFARNAALSTQLRYAQMMDVRTLADLRTTVGSIILGTIVIEAGGAFALWWSFADDPAVGEASALWLGIFHSISAFCSAGISMVDGGMARFATNLPVQSVIMVLTLLGGIGFPVLRELVVRGNDWARHLLHRRTSPRPQALSLATRVALAVSTGLVVGGAVVLGVLEWSASFRTFEPGYRVLAALFASVNTRTAGFASVDFGACSVTGLVVVGALMFIGGSPGSTAGGIKTTTFATLFATLRGELTGREPELGRRALTVEVVRRAVAVTGLCAGVVLLGVIALTLSESQALEKLVFEAVAAFTTTGFSTGITDELSTAGKLVVAALMFVGRIGPLTIALAVGTSVGATRYRLARESLPVG